MSLIFNHNNMKKTFAAIYLIICLFAMCCEPNEKSSLLFILTYFSAVILNLLIAMILVNKLSKNQENVTPKN